MISIVWHKREIGWHGVSIFGSSLFGVGSLVSCGQFDVELAGQEIDHW